MKYYAKVQLWKEAHAHKHVSDGEQNVYNHCFPFWDDTSMEHVLSIDARNCFIYFVAKNGFFFSVDFGMTLRWNMLFVLMHGSGSFTSWQRMVFFVLWLDKRLLFSLRPKEWSDFFWVSRANFGDV